VSSSLESQQVQLSLLHHPSKSLLNNNKLTIWSMVDGDVGTAVCKVNAQRISHLSYVNQLTNLQTLPKGDVEGVDRLDLVLVARLRPESSERNVATAIGRASHANEEVI